MADEFDDFDDDDNDEDDIYTAVHKYRLATGWYEEEALRQKLEEIIKGYDFNEAIVKGKQMYRVFLDLMELAYKLDRDNKNLNKENNDNTKKD